MSHIKPKIMESQHMFSLLGEDGNILGMDANPSFPPSVSWSLTGMLVTSSKAKKITTMATMKGLEAPHRPLTPVSLNLLHRKKLDVVLIIDFGVLGRLVYALGVFIECNGPSADITSYIKDTIQFIFFIRSDMCPFPHSLPDSCSCPFSCQTSPSSFLGSPFSFKSASSKILHMFDFCFT